jgi:hypothetical protein
MKETAAAAAKQGDWKSQTTLSMTRQSSWSIMRKMSDVEKSGKGGATVPRCEEHDVGCDVDISASYCD